MFLFVCIVYYIYICFVNCIELFFILLSISFFTPLEKAFITPVDRINWFYRFCTLFYISLRNSICLFFTFVPQFSQNLASGLRFSPQTLQYINTLSYPNKILRIAITLLYHLFSPPQPNVHLVANKKIIVLCQKHST